MTLSSSRSPELPGAVDSGIFFGTVEDCFVLGTSPDFTVGIAANRCFTSAEADRPVELEIGLIVWGSCISSLELPNGESNGCVAEGELLIWIVESNDPGL